MKHNIIMLLLLALALWLVTSCASPDQGYWQARQQAIASLPSDQRAQAEIDLMRDIHNDQVARRIRVSQAIDASMANFNQPGTFGNPIYIRSY